MPTVHFVDLYAVHWLNMTPQNKLRIANFLMALGVIPLLLGIIWLLIAIAYAQTHKGQMGGSDGFLMMAVLFVTYAIAVVVSGASALFSLVVAKRNTNATTRISTIIRTVTFTVLLAPFL